MPSSLAKKSQTEATAPHISRGLNLFDEMERMFENFSTKGWLRPFHWDTPAMADLTVPFETTMPSVDVLDRDNEILVKANLPGVEKKDIDISLTKSSVTIKGQTSHEEKEEKGDYYRCEISKGSYLRTLTLPSDVDDKKAKAKFKDGVLELTLPKLEVAERHSIKID